MSSTIDSNCSTVLLSDVDENDHSFDEMKYGDISENIKENKEGVAIPIKSFYGLKHASNTFDRSRKEASALLSSKPKKASERCLRLHPKPLKRKVSTAVKKTSKTVQKKIEKLFKATENNITVKSFTSVASTSRKFFKDRSQTEFTVSPVFNPKHRLPLTAILPSKNINSKYNQTNKKIFDKVSTSINNVSLKLSPISVSPKAATSIKSLSPNALQDEGPSASFDVNVENILDELLDDKLKKDTMLGPTCVTSRRENDDKSQMMIDAGQKNVESIICKKCGMLYLPNSEEDSALHFRFHNEKSDTVPFNGWKSERVVKEYVDGRVILILSSDSKYALNKVGEVRKVIDGSLGMTDQFTLKSSMQTFMFVLDKKVVGCVMAEAISKASRVIAKQKVSEPLCCSNVSQRAVCGINRIWVATAYRRKKIASRLIDCVKSNFYYGCVISDNELAFTGPSPSGQLFAENYMKRKTYLVYETV